MPGNPEKQLGRLDEIDKTKDKKISAIAGKEDQLTETYIKKTEELLVKTDQELDPNDPHKEKVRTSICDFLKQVDATNLETKESEFKQKIDGFIESVGERAEIQLRLRGLDESELGTYGLTPVYEMYTNLMNQDKEIALEDVMTLEDYVYDIIPVINEYGEAMKYFNDDQAVDIGDDKTLEAFLGEQTLASILQGKLQNPQEGVDSLKEQVEGIKEKTKNIEKFKTLLLKAGESSKMENVPGLSSPVEMKINISGWRNFLNDKTSVINLYQFLIEEKEMSPEEVKSRVSEIIKTPEFAEYLKAGKPDPEEVAVTILDAVIRNPKEGNEKSMIQIELYAKTVHEVARRGLISQKNEINKKKEELNTKLETFIEENTKETVKEIEKSVFEKMGNFLLGKDGAEKELIKTVSLYKGMQDYRFQSLLKIEKEMTETKAESVNTNLALILSSGLYKVSMKEVQRSVDEGTFELEDSKNMVDSVLAGDVGMDTRAENIAEIMKSFDTKGVTEFSLYDAAHSQLTIADKAVQEKDELLNNQEKRDQELEIRTMQETGMPLSPETNKAYVRQKAEKLRATYEENQKLKKVIAENLPEILDLTKKYNSIGEVPEEERYKTAEKAATMLQVLSAQYGFIQELKGLDVELQLMDPENGIKDDLKEILKNDSTENKKNLEDVAKFLGQETRIPEEYKINPEEAQILIYNQLNQVHGPKIENAFTNLSKSSEQMQWHFQKEQEYAESMQAGITPTEDKLGITYVDRLNRGIEFVNNMKSSIQTGRNTLEGLKTDLNKELKDIETGNLPKIYEDHPELIEARKKMINDSIKQIDKAIEGPFNEKQEEELDKIITQFESAKDDIIYDAIKTAVVFAAAIGAAMAGGWLVGAGLAKLGILGGATSFIVSNVAVAASATIGQRVGTEITRILPGTEWEADWSLEGLGKDFACNLAMSMVFTGAGRTIGKVWGEEAAKKAAIRTGGSGLSPKQLADAGLGKFALIRRMSNPFGKWGKKTFGWETAEEMGQEGVEEVADRINPVLGGMIATINASDGIDVNITAETQAKQAKAMKKLGVEFNENIGQFEFSQASAADFHADMISQLGKANNQVTYKMNDDGSVSILVNETYGKITVHPKAETVVDQKASEAEDHRASLDRSESRLDQVHQAESKLDPYKEYMARKRGIKIRIDEEIQREEERLGRDIPKEVKSKIKAKIEEIFKTKLQPTLSGKTEAEIQQDIARILEERHRLIEGIYLESHPDIEVVDKAKGIYRIKGTEIHGTIYSVMDTGRSITDIAEIVQRTGATAVGGLEIARMVVSGSGAQTSANPYPTDIDLAEYITLSATTREDAGKILAYDLQMLLRQEATVKPRTMQMTEVKFGEYPDGMKPIMEEKGSKMVNVMARGKSIKWTPAEIESGFKSVELDQATLADQARIEELEAAGYKIQNGNLIIPIDVSGRNPGMYKIDWLGVDQNGKLTEVTKVVNIEAPGISGFKALVFKNGPLQEVHMMDPSHISLMAGATSGEVLLDYQDFLVSDAAKYFMSGNALKASKRLYNLAKIEGRVDLIKQMHTVFKSEFAKLNQIQDQFSMLGNALEIGTTLGKPTLLKTVQVLRTELKALDSARIKPEVLTEAYKKIDEIESRIQSLEETDGVLKDPEIAEMLNSKEEGLSNLLKNESFRGTMEIFGSKPALLKYIIKNNPEYIAAKFDKLPLALKQKIFEISLETDQALFKKLAKKHPHQLLAALQQFDGNLREQVLKDYPVLRQAYDGQLVEFVESEGKARRLTVETDITNQEDLLGLQERILKLVPGAKPNSPDNFHVTLGHYGKPDKLFAQIQQANPAVDRAQFDRQLQLVMSRSQRALAENAGEIGITGIEEFHGGCLVATLDKIGVLKSANKIVYKEMIQMLDSLGVSNPTKFAKKSPDLMYLDPESFTPHVTLAYTEGRVVKPSALAGIKPESETVEMSGSYGRNVVKGKKI